MIQSWSTGSSNFVITFPDDPQVYFTLNVRTIFFVNHLALLESENRGKVKEDKCLVISRANDPNTTNNPGHNFCINNSKSEPTIFSKVY